MKVSSPPAYYDIFSIFTGTTLTNYAVPPHRALFIATTVTNTGNGIIVENFDGSTAAMPIIANTATLLPLAISKMTTALGNNTGTKIYGLL